PYPGARQPRPPRRRPARRAAHAGGRRTAAARPRRPAARTAAHTRLPRTGRPSASGLPPAWPRAAEPAPALLRGGGRSQPAAGVRQLYRRDADTPAAGAAHLRDRRWGDLAAGVTAAALEAEAELLRLCKAVMSGGPAMTATFNLARFVEAQDNYYDTA